jgi:hypothetical protein
MGSLEQLDIWGGTNGQEKMPTVDRFGLDREAIFNQYVLKDKKLLKLVKSSEDGEYDWHYGEEGDVLLFDVRKDSNGRTYENIKDILEKNSLGLNMKLLSFDEEKKEWMVERLTIDKWMDFQKDSDKKTPSDKTFMR